MRLQGSLFAVGFVCFYIHETDKAAFSSNYFLLIVNFPDLLNFLLTCLLWCLCNWNSFM